MKDDEICFISRLVVYCAQDTADNIIFAVLQALTNAAGDRAYTSTLSSSPLCLINPLAVFPPTFLVVFFDKFLFIKLKMDLNWCLCGVKSQKVNIEK